MLEIKESETGRMKDHTMNMEKLSTPELLNLFSVLEGELEARDLVIEVLKAQRRDAFVQERYGRYNLSDPFLALQRDSEVVRGLTPRDGQAAACSNPLAVLKLVVAHCKRMQEKMLSQLAAAESRHRKVIADLEEEKRRHAQDTAEGDDVTYMLEKERERLLQQLDFERAQVKRLEKEHRKLASQAEEDRAQHKHLSASLARECQRASARAQEEGRRAMELSQQLEEERAVLQGLRVELEAERQRGLQMEARAEEQLAEFDTEREQLRARLKKEEGRRRDLEVVKEGMRAEVGTVDQGARVAAVASVACQTEGTEELVGSTPPGLKLNGNHTQIEEEGPTERLSQNGYENGSLGSPVHLHQRPSPGSAGPSSITSSPCSSPVLTKRHAGTSATSPSYQTSYHASINQRFQAARHRFQSQGEPESQGPSTPRSPRDLSPAASPSEQPPSSVKQLARNTVTQVLSRFTSQQGVAKPSTPNSSPFGTDYRSLATSALSIVSKPSSPLSLGIRSPTMTRTERGNPPPIPPKKPGLVQSPASPGPIARMSHFPELSGSCGLSSNQEDPKERDLVMSSTS